MRTITAFTLGFLIPLTAWAQTAVSPKPPATEKVEFNSASRPLGRLMEQRARARGEDPKPTPGVPLLGYLAKPEGDGPFPAVVVLPRCDGITPFVQETLPQLLVSWGYVALAVDSLTTRKIERPCDTPVDRSADAYGGLFYLAGLPFVDRHRVGLLGIGNGGRIALTMGEAQEGEMIVNPDKLTFKAAVAYYPQCGNTGEKVSFPVLIMIGRDDQLARAQSCEDLLARRASDSAPTDVIVYPGVHNGFVESDRVAGMIFGIAWGEYNQKAAEESLNKARDFLGRHLGGTSR
jgi:dienelactone hydrolase